MSDYLKALKERYGGGASTKTLTYRGYQIVARQTPEPAVYHGVGHGPWCAKITGHRDAVHGVYRDLTEEDAVSGAKRIIDAIHGD